MSPAKKTEEAAVVVEDTVKEAPKKAATKKPAAKKAPAKKADAAEAPAKKPAATKAPVKKAAAKKAPAKPVAKKPAAKKAPAKKAVAKPEKPAKPSVQYCATGRRKNAVSRVRLMPGTGKVTCNGKDGVDFFGRQQLVDFALAPLRCVGQDGTMDIVATFRGGGFAGQAGALRLGIARALLEVNIDFRGDLKKAGHLKRDPRVVERKKYGLKKARKKPQFSKR